jgi:sec-independent protein translocase protein TatC
VVVGILIFAALFTSPSPLDMILLAIPMWLLYELGVLLAYFSVGRKRQQSSG